MEKAQISTVEEALKPTPRTVTLLPAEMVTTPSDDTVTSALSGRAMQKASAGIVELTGTVVEVVETTVVEVVVVGVELGAHTPTTLVVVLFATTADTEVPSVETIRPAPAPNAGVAVGVVIGVAAGFVVVGPVVDTVVELDGAVVATVVDVAVTTVVDVVVDVVVATVVEVVVTGVTSIRTLESLRIELLLVSATKMSPFAVTAMPFTKPNKVEAELPSAFPVAAEVPAMENSSGEAPVVSPRIFPGVPTSITECTES